MKPIYSIIIATNRDKEALKYIFKNDYEEAELIIIDSNYNNETLNYLRSINHKFNQVIYAPVKKVVQPTKRDFSQALNTALLYAEGDYIVKCDDMLELRPNFWGEARETVSYFEEIYGDRFAVIGQKLWESQKHEKWKSNFKTTSPWRKISNPMFTFSFGIYPTNDLQILNGYSEIYDGLGWGYEDVSFLHRLLALRYNVYFDTQLMAYSYDHPLGRSSFDFTDLFYTKFDMYEINRGKIRAFNDFDYGYVKEKFLRAKPNLRVTKKY